MAAPTLVTKKFWIITPYPATNYICNPQFEIPYASGSDPLEAYDVYSSDSAATISTVWAGSTNGSIPRRGSLCAKLYNANGSKTSMIYYGGNADYKIPVESGKYYSFSADVKGTEGDFLYIAVCNASGAHTVYAQKAFTATGRWERQTVLFKAPAEAGGDPYYVWAVVGRKSTNAAGGSLFTDGWQFESGYATTYFCGDTKGFNVGKTEFYWDTSTGLKVPRRCYSRRLSWTRRGGQLLDLDKYCKVVQVVGLGHGDWNQITTKLTSGGDYYQGHTRKSRMFSIVVDFIGSTLSEIERNRFALLDALRVDFEPAQPVVIRYQGFSAGGKEATQPIDIVCVPLPSMQNTPDIPSYQREVLNFMIPSGLLEGAYEEGAAL